MLGDIIILGQFQHLVMTARVVLNVLQSLVLLTDQCTSQPYKWNWETCYSYEEGLFYRHFISQFHVCFCDSSGPHSNSWSSTWVKTCAFCTRMYLLLCLPDKGATGSMLTLNKYYYWNYFLMPDLLVKICDLCILLSLWIYWLFTNKTCTIALPNYVQSTWQMNWC